MSVGAGVRIPVRVLVLAGRRAGPDPVALAAGRSLKALVPADGVPMLARVVDAIRAGCDPDGMSICGDDPALLRATSALETLAARGMLRAVPSEASPAASVRAFLEREPGGSPLLVTTADHALLTPQMVRHFLREGLARDAALVAAVVEAPVFRSRFPRARRTFIPLRDGALTGANLFLFRSPQALRAADFWRRIEGVRKRPWRVAAAFGPWALLRFLLGRLDRRDALARVSGAMGVDVDVVAMPFPECAVDVDTPGDLALVEEVLAQRRQARVEESESSPS